jgi:3-isopropylmalate/(R)-2-methylmalate dehydratase small subunit
MTEKIGGKVIKFGKNVNTDVIIPGRYLVSIDPQELAKHAFEPLGPEVQKRLWASQVVVGGSNFGCGSAREQAATALIGAGIKAVVAKSFSRVFFSQLYQHRAPGDRMSRSLGGRFRRR